MAEFQEKPKRKYMNQSLRMRIFKRDGGICQLCGVETRFFKSGFDHPFSFDKTKAGTCDHIVPVSKGGDNEEENLRWVCRSCNCARGNRA